MMADQQYVSAKRAREVLGLGVNKIAKLLSDKIPPEQRELDWKQSAKDNRVKLVTVASIEAFARREGIQLDWNAAEDGDADPSNRAA